VGRKKTSELDAAATRQRIVETAERLFRAVGYAKTTVADIARVLGMSPANVYRYFATKAAINEAICDRLVHSIEAQSLEALGEGGTATERLTRLVIAYHTVIRHSIIKEKRLYDMVVVAMDEHWSVIKQHSYRMCDSICLILEQGVAAGEFRTMDGPKKAIAIHEALTVFLYPSLLEHRINEDDNGDTMLDELRELLDLLLHGLCATA
jgi:AcrR family transcriptional regulator